MTVRSRSAAELTRLTPTEKRVAEHLVAGTSNVDAARALGTQPITVNGHVSSIGRKFGVTSRPARVHAVLATGQVPPPSAPAEVPNFADDELRLLRALAEHSEKEEIARAARIAVASVKPHVGDLVAKAGADNSTHLIGLAHAWGLLGQTSRHPGTSANSRTDLVEVR